jgi:nickel-dependent lactate racemase
LLSTLADREAGAAEPLAEVTDDTRAEIEHQVHDPANRDSLSYLAAAADGAPIYINRAIHDADLAISIGCLRFGGSLGYYGIHSDLYPTFSDEQSSLRYRSARSTRPAERRRLRRHANEVGWLLGVHFTVQAVPGARGGVLAVLAGDLRPVFREGRRLLDAAWRYSVPDRASLVVTTIEGDAAQQTWHNVARALAAASRAVRADGSVAVCCELAQRPGPAMQRVVGAEDLDAALRDIGRHSPADALAAAELVRALKRGSVYLVSRLDEDTVEELGMLPVAPDQISRLAARYDSCIVLSSAQYAQARPLDKDAADS